MNTTKTELKKVLTFFNKNLTNPTFLDRESRKRNENFADLRLTDLHTTGRITLKEWSEASKQMDKLTKEAGF